LHFQQKKVTDLSSVAFSGDYHFRVSSSYTSKIIPSVYKVGHVFATWYRRTHVLYVFDWHVNLNKGKKNDDRDYENVIEEAYE
jgi:hypothetical protein